MKLKNRILISFIGMMALFSVLTLVLGYYVGRKYIVGEPQRQMDGHLKTARIALAQRLEQLKIGFELTGPEDDFSRLKEKLGLDYIDFLSADGIRQSRSEIVAAAYRQGEGAGGFRMIPGEELRGMGAGLMERCRIEVKPTPLARRSEVMEVSSALAMEWAHPVKTPGGQVLGILTGGKVVNRDFELVDKIADMVFESQGGDGRPAGTVTIFLDDIRVSTNVLDQKGERAIGTRVSDKVYDGVVRNGKRWIGRAFVVTDWSLTAYEPITNTGEEIIGILYVGIPEKPFVALQRKILLVFLGISAVSFLCAMSVGILLSNSLAKPLTEIVSGIRRFSDGDWSGRLAAADKNVLEVNELQKAFNQMAERLSQRENRQKNANEMLEVSNQRYLDLIGFVSHELKGIISSAVLNVNSLYKEYLGSMNIRQKKVLESIAKSLDYLSAMVRNFLSLSRVEKGDLTAARTEVLLKEEVFDECLSTFSKPAAEKEMKFSTDIPEDFRVYADLDLMKIVANNLVGNAIKYGSEHGTILIRAKKNADGAEIEVYNDGTPLTEADQEKLFKRFSRLPDQLKKQRGTGLGLFITKEIIKLHDGRIWVETKPFGNSFVFTIGNLSA